MPTKFLALVALQRCRELRQLQTRAETFLWDLLWNRKCCGFKFYRQRAIFYEANGKKAFFIADFYSRELRLIIELRGLFVRARRSLIPPEMKFYVCTVCAC